jgi:serine protease
MPRLNVFAAVALAGFLLGGCGMPGSGDGADGAGVTSDRTGTDVSTTAVAPTIVNPAEELAEFSPTGLLRWSEVSGADAYEVWAYKDSGLTQLAEFSKSLVSRQYQFTQLAVGQTYYVKLYFRVGTTWSSIPTFQLKTAAAAVTKARFTNSQEELDAASSRATLRWTPVTNADLYEVWVYRDAALTALAETSGPVDITQYTLRTLVPNVTYYAQVYARVGGVYRTGGALTLRTTDQLKRARILNPQEELDAFASDGILRWSPVSGATAYELWVFKDPNSAQIQEGSGSLDVRSYNVRTLAPNTTYYAQAYARVNGEWQVGSPVKFTTVATPTKARLTNVQGELESFATNGTLRWTEVTGATAYEVWIYGHPGLGKIVESGAAGTERSYATTKLCAGATYYVQVYARVNGAWTTGWATKLETAAGTDPAGCVPPVPQVTLTASTPQVLRNETVTLTWSTKFAEACTASDAWTGARATGGTYTTPPLTAASRYSITCTGPGGSTVVQALVTLASSTASVAGSLLIPAITQVDSDVNDTAAPFRANDTFAAAQVLQAPAVVGGYVNEPGRGPDGRSSVIGDPRDTFRVNLATGQVIELLMPATAPNAPATSAGDADLELYDSSGRLVDESLGTGRSETLTVPASGTYFVRVVAWSGATLYRLSIGQGSATSTTSDAARLSDEFVPGQVIVQFRDGGDAGSASTSTTRAYASVASRLGVRRIAGDPSRPMLLGLPAAPDRAGVQAADGDAILPRIPESLRAKHETLLQAKRLSSDPDVEFAAVNRIVEAMAVPNDPDYPRQRWHYELIGLPAAWNVSTGSAAVTVAVVDTGVIRHPDLVANLSGGYDFVASTSNPDGNGTDADPDDPGCVLGGSATFHGTHVAGTVAAASNNGTGVAGVAWNVRIMPVRTLDGCSGRGTNYDVLQGIRYAAGLTNDSGTVPAKPADVINLSLGSAGTCDALSADLFAQVRRQGSIVVAAAGNDNSSGPAWPGSCANVVTVAAVGPRLVKSSYSNYGASWVDVAAPGGEMQADSDGDGQPDGVFSTQASGGGASRIPTYGLKQGSSMAAPHVAGVMALMKSVKPSLTPAEVDAALAQGQLTQDIGVAGPDDLGVGLIDAFKAVQFASGNAPALPPALTVTPSALDFGDVGTSAEVRAWNSGSGTLTVTSTTRSASWLQVGGVQVLAGGLGRYSIAVSRGTLPAGNYSGWVEFTSNAGAKRVQVTMRVAAAPAVPNAGFGYGLLVDPGTNVTAHAIGVVATGLPARYRFDGVRAGLYYVLFGSDMDHDRTICEEGEFCGVYPVEARPERVRALGTVTGIDFAAAFRMDLAGASSTEAPAEGAFAGVALPSGAPDR